MVTTQKCYPFTLIVWCIKLKLKMFMKILVRIKISKDKPKYCDALIKLFVGKMKDETAGVATEKRARFK